MRRASTLALPVRSKQSSNAQLSFVTVVCLMTLLLTGQVAAETDTLLGPPPGTYRLLNADSVARIPFTVYRGDILMKCAVNGREARMMLDNGHMWDELLFWGCPRTDSLQLHYDGQVDVGGPGEGAAVPSRTASGIAISFPGVEFAGQSAIVTSPDAQFDKMWENTDGQVSATFFKHFVVDMNFDSGIITLIRPQSYHHKGEGVALPLKPYPDGSWSIPGKLTLEDGRTLDLDFVLDLGYGDALQIDSREQHKIPIPGKALESGLGFGAQGETHGYKGRVRKIAFDKYALEDVLTGFVAPDDKGTVRAEAMIGMEIFSRFNIVFDYPHRTMYLTPNRSAAKGFECDMTGMILGRGKNNTRVIERIYPNSPASEAGLVVGDTITQINGATAGQYSFWDLIPLFSAKGTSVSLSVKRGDKDVPCVLTLRRVI
jgi:hypothetical protein